MTFSNRLLMRAVKRGSLLTVRISRLIGANIRLYHDKPFRLACRYGHLNLVKYFLNNGADINANQAESLELALRTRNLHLFKFLVENGASRDRAASLGAVETAYWQGDYQLVVLLIQLDCISKQDALYILENKWPLVELSGDLKSAVWRKAYSESVEKGVFRENS